MLVATAPTSAGYAGQHAATGFAAGEPESPATQGGVDAKVLEREEHRRRIGALTALLSGYAVTTLILAALSVEQRIYVPLTVVCGANALLAGVLLFVAKKQQYPDLVSAGAGISAVILGLMGCAYFGVSSGSVVIFPVLVYYFGTSDSAVRRRLVFGSMLAGYGATTLLTLLGTIPPLGIVELAGVQLGPTQVSLCSLIVLQILLGTYWLARKSRRSTLLAMSALEHARRRIRERDALLHEANADLELAMAGPRRGRYTGQQLGPFDVGEIIGRGGIAEVYEAHYRDREQAVALKVLHPHLLVESEHIERFMREVQITSALSSPNLPATLESGTTPDGSPYLAMERLNGTDLATDLRQRRRLPPRELDALVQQVAAGLSVAHAAGVIHRDIKPQNLFRTTTPPGRWTILDFGVSRLVTDPGTLTGGAAIGTPAYMAPEQVAGGEVDARTDVFALASVVYRALTGRPAFSGPSQLATMMRVAEHQPARPGEIVATDKDVELLLAVALAKNPAQRIESAAAFAEAWKTARAGRLDARLRSTAERILAEHPWGSELEGDGKTTVYVPSSASA